MREAAAVILVLPDQKLVLQRRDNHPLFSPNELGFFGGGSLQNETPHQTAERELNEEISEPIPRELIKPLFNEVHQIKTKKGVFKVLVHVFQAPIHNRHLTVYEGRGAETYTIDEALGRNDLAEMTRYVLERVKKKQYGTGNN